MGLIRLALAIAVLLSHVPSAEARFIGGGLAVQGFFVVSGFYMALVLDSKYADRRLFYSNRALRLAPLYFITLAASSVAMFVFGVSATAWPEIFSAVASDGWTLLLAVAQNLLIVGQELLFWFKIAPDGSLYFDAFASLPTVEAPIAWQMLLVPQSWSLSMEIAFYLLAPLLATLRWPALAAIAIASIGLRLCGHLLDVDYGLWQGRFFPTALFLFVLGMLAHRALPVALRAPTWVRYLALAVTLGVVTGLPLMRLPAEAGRWLVYLVIAASLPLVFLATREVTWDRWVGDLSYPIYLTHLLVLAAVLHHEIPYPTWSTLLGSVVVSVVLLAAVDRPVDRWRQRRAVSSSAPCPDVHSDPRQQAPRMRT